MSTILLTGATGYIGSHTWVALLEAGYDVIGIDNLSNSSAEVLDKITAITGKPTHFVQGDVRKPLQVLECFEKAARIGSGIDAVIHFAAKKAVGESVEQPINYFDNNLGGLISVLQSMDLHGVKNLVFSSSATVYGMPESLPISEFAALGYTNPYGLTKLVGEQMLDQLVGWNIAKLRYFNPVGAHSSGWIGEDPRGIPNNLMPYVAQVASGEREFLSVFGSDYPTKDGTGVRDYIHVCDLAEGHVAAVAGLLLNKHVGTVNLGTGVGYSVLEVVSAYEKVCGKEIPVRMMPRRAGDVAVCYANAGLAKEVLGWEAKRTLDEMCQDSWRFQTLK